MASALYYLHCLVHKIELEQAVDKITGTLSSSELISFYKPMEKLPQMTQFKRMVHAAHQEVSMKILDLRVEEQAVELKKCMGSLRDSVAEVYRRLNCH